MIDPVIETSNYDEFRVLVYTLQARGFFFRIFRKKKRDYTLIYDSEPWKQPEVYRVEIARQLGYIAYRYYRTCTDPNGGPALSNLIKTKLTTPKKKRKHASTSRLYTTE